MDLLCEFSCCTGELHRRNVMTPVPPASVVQHDLYENFQPKIQTEGLGDIHSIVAFLTLVFILTAIVLMLCNLCNLRDLFYTCVPHRVPHNRRGERK